MCAKDLVGKYTVERSHTNTTSVCVCAKDDKLQERRKEKQEQKKERIQGSVCAKDDKWVKKRRHNSSTTAENLDKRQEAEKQNAGDFLNTLLMIHLLLSI